MNTARGRVGVCFGEEAEVCANCGHYYTHYLEDGTPVCIGHCAFPRIKARKLWESCERFERAGKAANSKKEV